MIGILGAGSWGTALAIQAANNHKAVLLWEHNLARAKKLSIDRENQSTLPGIQFPDSLTVTHDLQECIKRCDTLLLALPSAAIRGILDNWCAELTQGIAWASKGLTADGKLLHQLALEILGEETPLAVLSGPSFALEVAKQQPTAVCLAANHQGLADRLANYLRSDSFRIYLSDDLTGVCLGGAYKNILAIAAGIADGLSLGHNARAALITRGLAEMQRLGVALGGREESLYGLAGLGDLVLTCTGDLSRNRRLGIGIAKGGTLFDVRAKINQSVEGIETARVIYHLAKSMQIELPIADAVYQVLFEGQLARQAVNTLLSR